MYSMCPLLCLQYVRWCDCDPVLSARGGSPTLRRLKGDVVVMSVYEERAARGAAKVAIQALFELHLTHYLR